jgi:predicted permease
MLPMGELWRRLWFLLNRARLERELREEMEAHRAMIEETGAPFGNTLRLRDEAVDAWGWRWLDRLTQDLRFGTRLLWRAPVFTLTAVAVLALGVGVNLAAFQMFDRLALSPRPVRDPQTLVNLHRRSPNSASTSFSYPAFDFYRRYTSRLTGAMALVSTDAAVGDDEARHVPAAFVSGNYLLETGATPLAGRLFDSTDERPDAPPIVAISEDLWRIAFAADAGAVGRVLRVNGRPFTVIGIVPRTFVGVNDLSPSIWIPITQHPAAFPGSTLLDDWTGGAVQFYGRVASGDVPAAEAELRGAADALREQRPRDVWKDEWLQIRSAGRMVTFNEAAPAFVLIGALVGLVLVAACMNLGLLVLARTLVRDREFAIRLSVGATQGRLVRQLLTEHVLLGALGAAAGCFVAVQTSAVIFKVTGSPAGIQPSFNVRTLLAAISLAVVSAVVFGFAPVWQTLRPASARRLRMRSVLLAVQVMAASALLIVSGLLVRGVTRIVRVPLGFDYHHAVVADPDLVNHGASAESASAYWRRVEARLRQIGTVRNVAVSTLPPLGNRVALNGDRTVLYDVTPAYFDTLQIALRRGRIFAADERGVVMVSESLAKRRWPGEDALGKLYDEDIVIGVVNDARTVRLSEPGATECYRPIQPKDMPGAVLVVRVDGSPRVAASSIRSIMQNEDARLMPQVAALEDALGAKLSGQRQAAQIVSLLGACALLLAVTGLGGMVAFTVSQRRREIGVRLALGARPVHVLRAVIGQFSVPVVAGATAGSVLAAIAGTVLAGELYGLSGFDPVSHLGAFVLFGAVTSLAAIPSLRRAVRVDPVRTLRHE